MDEYLALRCSTVGVPSTSGAEASTRTAVSDAAAVRAARKEVARLERQLDKLRDREKRLHDELAAAATDHERVLALDADLRALLEEREELEQRWLEAAETAES